MKKLFFLFAFLILVLPYSNAQDCSMWGADSVQSVRALSLYKEFYKQNNFDDAFIHWRYVFLNAPGAREFAYIDGVELIKKRIEKATDKIQKEKWVDTLWMVYDQRIKCFGNAGSILGRKGLDMMRYIPSKTNDIIETLSKSVEYSKDKTEYYVIAPYFQLLINAYKSNLKTKEEVINTYDILNAIIDNNTTSKYADKYKEAQELMAQLLADSKLLSNCDDAKNIYLKKYQAYPDDVDLWKKILNLLKSTACMEDPLFIEISEKLHKKEPTPNTAYFMARAKTVQGKISEAVSYFNEAIDLEIDESKKADYYFDLAKITSSKLNDFPKARTYALKAASLRSKWGEPYLFIGDLYASSGKLCGPGTGFESQVVTWAAIDMYEKSKTVDAGMSGEANKRIANYSKYMPSKDDLFFHNLKEGQTYMVECWINETTTVRAAKE